ncbi:MAG: metal-dependent transcriptional regulator [Clostridia bacterium]|nr:metal-dependent transcriptional regulator [Clostridia bacterium]
MEKNEKTVEDYLEAMLMIQEKQGYIRSIDVAEQLSVKKPSVTYATKRLKEKGYITMDADNLISFTEAGFAIASQTYERHKLLTKVFTMLGVSEDNARKDACRVEHDLSEETYRALAAHLKEYESK